MDLIKYFEKLLHPLRGDPTAAINREAMVGEPRTVRQSPETTSREARFEQELEHLLASRRLTGEPIVAGSVEIVGFDEIKDSLGDGWNEVSARAAAIAEQEIRRRLGPDDIVHQHNDTEFSICFASLDKSRAEAQAKRIAREIKLVLQRELPEFSTRLTVRKYVSEVSATEMVSETGSFADRLITTMHRLRLEAVHARNHYRKLLLKDFHLMFAPIWEPKRERLQLNRCVLDLTAGFSTLSQFQAVADPDTMIETLAELDCLVLTRSLETLHLARRSGLSTAAIVIPVGFQTLASPVMLAHFTKLLDSIPETYLPLVNIEITTLPGNTSANQVLAVLDTLASFSGKLVLQLNGNPSAVHVLNSDRVWAFGWNLTELDTKDPARQSMIANLIAMASESGVKSIAHGANSIGLALWAVEAGFDYVDGTAIHLFVDHPRAPSRLHPLTYPKRSRFAS